MLFVSNHTFKSIFTHWIAANRHRTNRVCTCKMLYQPIQNIHNKNNIHTHSGMSCSLPCVVVRRVYAFLAFFTLHLISNLDFAVHYTLAQHILLTRERHFEKAYKTLFIWNWRILVQIYPFKINSKLFNNKCYKNVYHENVARVLRDLWTRKIHKSSFYIFTSIEHLGNLCARYLVCFLY